jgi:hypothetical protein
VKPAVPGLQAGPSDRDQPDGRVKKTEIAGIGGHDLLPRAARADHHMGIDEVRCSAWTLGHILALHLARHDLAPHGLESRPDGFEPVFRFLIWAATDSGV